jgi:hypothetical protein
MPYSDSFILIPAALLARCAEDNEELRHGAITMRSARAVFVQGACLEDKADGLLAPAYVRPATGVKDINPGLIPGEKERRN